MMTSRRLHLSLLSAVAMLFLMWAPASQAAPRDGGIDAPQNEPCSWCNCAKIFNKRFCSCAPEDLEHPGEKTAITCDPKGTSWMWCAGDDCAKSQSSWGDVGLYPV